MLHYTVPGCSPITSTLRLKHRNHMAALQSPSRRALAPKSTNASLNVNKGIKHADKASIPRTAQLPPPDSKSKSTNEVTTPSSPLLGQNRKIEEVEEPGIQESQYTNGSDEPSLCPPSRTPFSDTDVGDMVDSTDNTRSTGVTPLSSFHASQEGPGPVETQFEIPVEMSQRALDNLVPILTTTEERWLTSVACSIDT